MNSPFFYTIFFWIAWIFFIPVILKITPIGTELILIIVYSIIGVALYFLIPILITACVEDWREKKYQNNNSKTGTRKNFLNEQRLVERYRYLKLNKIENIITSNIDSSDKISLLEIVHGYAPETALRMIKDYKDKKPAA
jgi:hypothetical protein